MNPLSHSLSRLRETLRLPLLIAGLGGVLAVTGCGSKEEAEAAAKASPTPADLIAQQPKVHGIEIKTVELTKPLKQEWVAKGKATYDMKCLPCHCRGRSRGGPGLGRSHQAASAGLDHEHDHQRDMMLERC